MKIHKIVLGEIPKYYIFKLRTNGLFREIVLSLSRSEYIRFLTGEKTMFKKTLIKKWS